MQILGRLLLIKPGEGDKTAFFTAFFLLLGAGLAVGKGSADALFIKRYGVEYFPLVYLFLSLHLALFSLLYAALVDRLPAEKFFRILLLVQILVLAAVAAVIRFSGVEIIYPLYYIVYAVCSELLLLHAALYIGQNFDTQQSKRLTPVIFAGYQFGMMAGGLLLVYIVPVMGLGLAPLLWLALTMLAAFLLAGWHIRYGTSPYYYQVHKPPGSRLASAINEIAEGVQYTRRSPLLINAAWALFFMVVTFYMLSYCANTIYTEVFADETLLAGFFGKLVIVTNIAAMLIQLLVTSRLIGWLGIRKANYIYPVTTMASFVLLLIQPGFYAALFASLNRETIMPAIRTPVRQLFFNVLPDRVKGRARAISVAIVMPAALFACGGLILLTKQTEGIASVAVLGLVCSMIYLVFSLRMGREYIGTLIASMREKLYLPETESLQYADNSSQLIEALEHGIQSTDGDVSLSYARALITASPEHAVKIILQRVRGLDVKSADRMLKLLTGLDLRPYIPQLEQAMHGGDEHMRSTVLNLLVQANYSNRKQLIEDCLQDKNPRLRVGAIAAACTCEPDLRKLAEVEWHQCLRGDLSCRYAAIELIPLLAEADIADMASSLRVRYIDLIADMLDTADEQRRVCIYRAVRQWGAALPEKWQAGIDADREHASPYVREAVTALLPLTGKTRRRRRHVIAALADGHIRVRQAALAVVKNSKTDDVDACYHLLRDNAGMTPRAQKVLLEDYCRHAPAYDQLEQLVMERASYAAQLLCAIAALPEAGNTELSLLKTVLRERLQQMIDLILLALQPMCSDESVQVIRAGLSSRDSRHVANAMEALSELKSKRIFRLIGYLVQADCEKVVAKGHARVFNSISEVTAWSCKQTDEWLCQCAQYVNDKLKEKACA